MNADERLQLNKMIKESNVIDKTETIRKLKHSEKLKADVELMCELKKDHYDMDYKDLEASCFSKCSFLSQNYYDIYIKLLKDELDKTILMQFIEELKNIEDGRVDQHEASVNVGKLLKQLYIDSALKKAEKLDNNQSEEIKKPEIKQVSWLEYKKNNL